MHGKMLKKVNLNLCQSNVLRLSMKGMTLEISYLIK